MPWQFYLATVLSIGALVFGILRMRAETIGDQEKIYLYRPLTMALIALVAMVAPAPVSIFYKGALVLALLLAILGEAIMMIRGTPTIVAVIFVSLIALLYLFAFSSLWTWRVPTPWALLIPVAVAVLFWVFNPYLGEFWFPSLAFMGILAVATWLSLELFVGNPALWTAAAFGGLLAVDAAAVILGVREFRGGFRGDTLVMAGVYYVGQWLMAVSIWGG